MPVVGVSHNVYPEQWHTLRFESSGRGCSGLGVSGRNSIAQMIRQVGNSSDRRTV